MQTPAYKPPTELCLTVLTFSSLPGGGEGREGWEPDCIETGFGFCDGEMLLTLVTTPSLMVMLLTIKPLISLTPYHF